MAFKTTKIISASLLSTLVSAGLQQMNEQLATLMQNATITDRNLIPLLGPTFNQINQYGCWCYSTFRNQCPTAEIWSFLRFLE